MRKFIAVLLVVLVTATMPSNVHAFSCSVGYSGLTPYKREGTVVRARLTEGGGALDFDVIEVLHGEAGDKLKLSGYNVGGPFSTQSPYAVRGKDYIIFVPTDGRLSPCDSAPIFDITKMDVVSFVLHSRLLKASRTAPSEDLYKEQIRAINLFAKEVGMPTSAQETKRYIYFYKIAVQIAHGDYDAAQVTWNEMYDKAGTPNKNYQRLDDARHPFPSPPDDVVALELQGRIYLGRGDLEAANDFFAKRAQRSYYFAKWHFLTLHDLGRLADLPKGETYEEYQQMDVNDALASVNTSISKNSQVEALFPVPMHP